MPDENLTNASGNHCVNAGVRDISRPVADATGLAGIYDLRLAFARDLRDADRPSVFAALREQLGLQLEPARGPIDTIVIAHAALPDAN